jgi:hypothetical protein
MLKDFTRNLFYFFRGPSFAGAGRNEYAVPIKRFHKARHRQTSSLLRFT